MPLELSITNEQQVKLHITPTTLAGKPAKLDGAPIWTKTGGSATVVPAEDGLSADLISSDDDLSDTTVEISADADLGAGVEEIKDVVLLHIIHANAKSLGLTADEPTLKP